MDGLQFTIALNDANDDFLLLSAKRYALAFLLFLPT